jgi:hypothetical protein
MVWCDTSARLFARIYFRKDRPMNDESAPRSKLMQVVAWYTREQWPRLRELAADPEALEPTYDQWQVAVNRGLAELEQTGCVPQPVEIDVEELAAWCEERECPLNSAARAAYAADLARRGSERNA